MIGNASLALAQQQYFAYFQTDNHQPFFVKLNSKLLSSSSSGYLIIPKLQNGVYIIHLGFPKNEKAEQTFNFTVNGRDLGYLIKDFGEKGWGLFNFQTMEVLMASKPSPSQKNLKDTSTDAFSNILANVVNTPSIKEKTVEAAEQKVQLPAVKVNTDSNNVATAKNNGMYLHKKSDSANQPTLVNNKVVRYNTIIETEGRTFIYIVKENGQSDTVRVFLPVSKIKTIAKPLAEERLKKENSEIKSKNQKPSEKFLQIELPNPNVGNASGQPDSSQKQANNAGEGKLKFNSDCKSIATNEDFINVRRKMVAQETENEMINEAQKYFKQKCYATEQVKGLSSLILGEKNKVEFFKIAYPFVYDTNNFPSLQGQLTQEAYIKSFKAMLIK